MSSLTQYITLFEQNRQTIESHSPEVLNRRREHALEVLRALPRLPERGDEGFPKVSLEQMFAPDFGVNISRIPFVFDAAASSACLPAASQPAAIVVNDSFVVGSASLPEGVEVCSIAEAATRYPHLFDCEIAPTDNPIVALNDLMVEDGVFIRITRGTSVSRPVQVLSVFNSALPMMGVRRVRIVVEDDARAAVLLCDHPVDNAAPHLACRVVEISVGQNASFDLYDLEESGALSSRASVCASVQQPGSSLNVCGLFLRGGITRNEFYPRHAGQNCSTRLGGIVIGGGEQIIDNAVFLTHSHPRCRGEQLFKYALFDSAQGSFEGIVKVDKGAVFTETHQTNRNLLGSEGARMYAMPQLEIYCDEVKASHGSATGRLDERALFYLRSRGIPENEARMMLVNAFMTDVLDFVGDDALRERLRHLVDCRLRGVEAVCAGCHS